MNTDKLEADDLVRRVMSESPVTPVFQPAQVDWKVGVPTPFFIRVNLCASVVRTDMKQMSRPR